MWTELYDEYMEASMLKYSEQNSEQNCEVNIQCMWQEIINAFIHILIHKRCWRKKNAQEE